MKKILPYRFKQSFGPFNMLAVHKCIWGMEKKFERIFSDLEIIAFELVGLDTRFY